MSAPAIPGYLQLLALVAPVLFLLLARHAPFTSELRQVILGTTALGVFLIPGLLRFGLAWMAP